MEAISGKTVPPLTYRAHSRTPPTLQNPLCPVLRRTLMAGGRRLSCHCTPWNVSKGNHYPRGQKSGLLEHPRCQSVQLHL